MSYINSKFREAVFLSNATRIVPEEERNNCYICTSYIFTALFSLLFFSFAKLQLKFFPQFFNDKPILLIADDLQGPIKREEQKGKCYLVKVNVRVRGRKMEQLYSSFLAISFIFVIVLPSSEHYPRLQKRDTP